MPAKKVVKSKKVSGGFDFQDFMDNPDSYKNLIYGIITVVVLFVVLFLGLRTLSKNQSDVTENAVNTTRQEARTHTVEEGETLWSIAEKEYGDGFKWELIADANNVNDASVIEKGTKLKIPAADTKVSSTVMDNLSGTPAMPTPTEVVAREISPTAAVTRTPTAMTSPTTVPNPTEVVPQERKVSGTTYKVVEGDYLWDIAVRAYGDGYRWVEIANENSIANPDLIYPGDQIKLKRP